MDRLREQREVTMTKRRLNNQRFAKLVASRAEDATEFMARQQVAKKKRVFQAPDTVELAMASMLQYDHDRQQCKPMVHSHTGVPNRDVQALNRIKALFKMKGIEPTTSQEAACLCIFK